MRFCMCVLWRLFWKMLIILYLNDAHMKCYKYRYRKKSMSPTDSIQMQTNTHTRRVQKSQQNQWTKPKILKNTHTSRYSNGIKNRRRKKITNETKITLPPNFYFILENKWHPFYEMNFCFEVMKTRWKLLFTWNNEYFKIYARLDESTIIVLGYYQQFSVLSWKTKRKKKLSISNISASNIEICESLNRNSYLRWL